MDNEGSVDDRIRRANVITVDTTRSRAAVEALVSVLRGRAAEFANPYRCALNPHDPKAHLLASLGAEDAGTDFLGARRFKMDPGILAEIVTALLTGAEYAHDAAARALVDGVCKSLRVRVL
jgi:hypothetical protein